MSDIDTINSEGSLSEVRMNQDPLYVNGTMITDRYRAEKLIGRGGFGEVYKAFDLVLNREVAVKVLYKKDNSSQEVHRQNVSRFLNEARITAQLKHPALPITYDFGQLPQGEFFLVCELLNGQSLSAQVKKEALDPIEALNMLQQVASAVHVAHEHGILHRDLKPSNIFCMESSGQGRIEYKVLDFGIAKGFEEHNISGMLSEQTQVNSLIGSPRYLAPERLKRLPNYGPPSDVYSLGVVLFIALTQKFPYNGRSVLDIGMQHLMAPIPKLELDQISDHQLDKLQTFFEAMMAKDPDDRIPTAQEVAERAQALLSNFQAKFEVQEVNSLPSGVLELTTELDGSIDSLNGQSLSQSVPKIGEKYTSLPPIEKQPVSEKANSNIESTHQRNRNEANPTHHFPNKSNRPTSPKLLIILIALFGIVGFIWFQQSNEEQKEPALELTKIKVASKGLDSSQQNLQPAEKKKKVGPEKQLDPQKVNKIPKKPQTKSRSKVMTTKKKKKIPRQKKVKSKQKASKSEIKVSKPVVIPTKKEVSTTPQLPQAVKLKVSPLKATYLIGDQLSLKVDQIGGIGQKPVLSIQPSNAGHIKGSRLKLKRSGKLVIKACVSTICTKKSLLVFDQPVDEF